MSIEDDFYSTIKFKSGEEIFAKVAASDEGDRTMLIINHPIIVSEIRGWSGIVGYKVEPWLKTTKEDMFIINLQDVLTLSESTDAEMINMYQNFLEDTRKENRNRTKINRRMGYLGTVNDTKMSLEKIFKESKGSKNNQS